MESIKWSNNLTAIRILAFTNCPLQDPTLPESVTEISDFAFWNCKRLKHVSIPGQIKNYFIGQYVSNNYKFPFNDNYLNYLFNTGTDLSFIFYECDSIESIYINSDTNREMFKHQKLLKKVELGDSVTNIIGTFKGCTHLETVVLSKNIKSMWSAFEGCTNLSEVVFNKGLLFIDDKTFSGCTNLKKVALPSTLTTIGRNALASCLQLKTLSFLGSEFQISGLDGVLLIDHTELDSLYLNLRYVPHNMFYYRSRAISEDEGCHIKKIAFSDSVKEIGYHAFRNCMTEHIYLGKNIQKIYDGAFRDNLHLKDLYLPEGIDTINNYTFSGYSITDIYLPSTLKHIRTYGIRSSVLENVYIKATIPPTTESYAIFAYRSQATLHVPAGCKEAYEAAKIWKDFNIIEEKTTDIHAVQNASPSTESETWYDLQGRKVATQGKASTS
ncbi:MAG: leucine-rich repeat domain-containing protein [Bacteroidaceae bacterium]|nr:leucine-rich repeat domain-containing protein [Bacteroidaceae bacterium]